MKLSPMKWLRPPAKWAEPAKYWATVPRSAMFLLLTGIFCLFAAFGLMTTLINVRHVTTSFILVMALDTGLFGALLAWCAFRAFLKTTIAVVVVNSLVIF